MRKNPVIIFCTLFATLALALFTACGEDKEEDSVVKVTGVMITSSSGIRLTAISLAPNETYQINVKVEPENATNKGVTFSSSNEDVAIVSASGLITPVEPGATIITVTTQDGNYTAQMTVQVTRVGVEGIKFVDENGDEITELDIEEGQSASVKVQVEPSDAWVQDFEVSSSVEVVATVVADPSGATITAKWPGAAAVVAQVVDGFYTYESVLHVKVAMAPALKELTTEGRTAQLVDLGLPSGTLWADRNVGATSPTDMGQWFYWEVVETPSDQIFTEEHHLSLVPLPLEESIAGTIHDAAAMRWGGKWYMPTTEQCRELIDECVWTQIVVDDGQKGYRVTNKNDADKFIFLPFTASCDHRGWVRPLQDHDWGCYWTSTPNGDTTTDYLYINEYENLWINMPSYGPNARFAGLSIRPVQDP